MSTQKAAENLGFKVMTFNAGQDFWAWETGEGAIMNGTTVEHIKDAAKVIGQYCDVVAIRCFADLKNKKNDTEEWVLSQFQKYVGKPLISLESATRHPLQSLADSVTIQENLRSNKKPKVVLTWAPHIKPIPHAVANSFAEWMNVQDVEFVITHPEGFDLDPNFVRNATVTHNQEEALKDADFVYIKNWSSFNDYGKVGEGLEDWMLTNEKMKVTNNGKPMHCLPVRRNVEVSDEVLDSEQSLIFEQSYNRLWAAQAVLKNML
jgi:N-succinyl-L-ornithine transcarbamylase